MAIDDTQLQKRFLANMQRANALVELGSGRSPGADAVAPEVRDDVLRAAVVFMHATLEDLVRTVGRGLAPSLMEWDRASLGSSQVLRRCLVALKLDPKPFEFLFPGLDSLFNRRHDIVHNADLPKDRDEAPKTWSTGDNVLLVFWLIHVLTFFHQLWAALYPEDSTYRSQLESYTKAVGLAKEAIQAILKATELLKETKAILTADASLIEAARASLREAESKLLEAKAALTSLSSPSPTN